MSSPDGRERASWWPGPEDRATAGGYLPDGGPLEVGPLEHAAFDAPRRWPRVLAAVAIVVAFGASLAVVVTHGGQRLVAGYPAPAPGIAHDSPPPAPPSSRPAEPITLINPVSGLTYQVPSVDWTVQQRIGDVASVSLSQGARRSGYNCGNPAQPFLRGLLGSGAAASADPSDLASALADQLATRLYTPPGGLAPQVRVEPAQPVARQTPSGATVIGAQVRATATQTADPCLAGEGEVIVLVLRLADHDAVFMINGDVAGGPADPGPATDPELRQIVASVRPVSG